jgi:hypothetical protein
VADTVDIKYEFVVTGENEHENGTTDAWFMELADTHVYSEVRRLNALRGKANFPLTLPAEVHFIHFNFHEGKLSIYKHSFPKGKVINQLPATREAIKKDPTKLWTDLPSNHFVAQAQQLRKQQAGQTQQISILDMYHAVRQATPGTIIDVSIYSHGFVEGPVLAANSNDQLDRVRPAPDGSRFPLQPGDTVRLPKRDPQDTDGRVRTDFAKNMGEDPTKAKEGANALAEFRAGFIPSGATYRVYGCNVQDIPFHNGARVLIRATANQVITDVWIAPRKFARADARGIIDGPNGLTHLNNIYTHQAERIALGKKLMKATKSNVVKADPVVLHMGAEFNLEQHLGDEERRHLDTLSDADLLAAHYDTDLVRDPITNDEVEGTFFKTSTGAKETSPDLSRTYDQVIKFLAGQIMKLYAFAAARALPNVTVFGGLPGSSGEREAASDTQRMHVDEKYQSLLNFYSIYMGISTREPGADRQRNYGVFDAAMVAKINALRTGS